MIRLTHVAALCFISVSLSLSAQETASQYFDTVSEHYKTISDYTANLTISRGTEVQTAVAQYKKPNLLRLDFSNPAGMVIAVNSEKLMVWVPGYSVTFEQDLRPDAQEQTGTLATPGGLALLARYYTIAYAEDPAPVALEAGSSERVMKLRLNWKSNNEGFRELIISVNSNNKMIRRIEGRTTTGARIVFDFTNIVLNSGIPDTRFDYESPPIGNSIENFLFDPGN